MAKRTKAFLILGLILLLVVGSAFFILLRPANWSKEIVQYLNKNILEGNGWTLSLEAMDGRLTSDVHLRNLYLKKKDGSIVVFSENSVLNLDFRQIVSGRWGINRLFLDNVLVTVRPLDDGSVHNLQFVQDLVRNGFNVQDLRMHSAALIIQEESGERLYSLDLEGSVDHTATALTLLPQSISVTELRRNQEILIDGGLIELGTSYLRMKQLEGRIQDVYVKADGDLIFLPYFRLVADVTAKDVQPPRILEQELSDIIGTDRVDIHCELETDLASGALEGRIFDSHSQAVIGQVKLDLAKDGREFVLNESEFKIGSTRVNGSGSYSGEGDLALNVDIDGLNLKEFDLLAKPTQISGAVQLTGLLAGATVENLAATVDLQNNAPGSEDYLRVSGGVLYDDGRIEVSDSLLVDFGYGKIFAFGKVDLSNERMNATVVAESGDLGALAAFMGLETGSGKVRGTVDLTGYVRDPSVSGYLSFEDVSASGIDVESFSVSFLINSLLRNRHGSLRALATKGLLRGYPVEKAAFDLYFRGDTILVSNARLAEGDDFLQLAGKVVGNDLLVVDQMQLSAAGHYVTNTSQVTIARTADGWSMNPAHFRINDGRAELSLSMKEGRIEGGTLKIVNLDLGSLASATGREFPITGAMFADFTVSSSGDWLVANGTFEVKDGFWGKVKFDNLIFTCDLEKDVLHVKEFRLIAPGDMSFELAGFCGVDRDEGWKLLRIKPDAEISFASEFRNVELNLLKEHFPETWSLGGGATGSLIMSGVAEAPNMVFEFSIDKPWFGKIRAKMISGSGRYTDERLYLEDLVGYSYAGHYTGGGYLPLDLSLVPRQDDRFLETEPVSLEFKATTSSLDFLTPYFADVDSIVGAIELELQIAGTPARPIRDGRVVIKDGTIYALMLDLPITDVDGSAVLKDNKFIIDELVAASHVPATWRQRFRLELSSGVLQGVKKTRPGHNLRIAGSMDMEAFFHPNLALLVTGEDVYVRTLLGEIEGIADLNLSVTGKDTINIVGDIIPSEAVLRMEFEEEESYEETQLTSVPRTHYKLHFPIARNLYLQNNQVDAELDGDMSIYKLGSGPYRYSGELNVRKGKFYYYSDVFDIQEGHLFFDPTEFNPRMDIRASTEISGIDIDVTVTGDFEEPEIVLETQGNEGFYSQSDLLQLLTIQKRFGDEGLSGGGLGDQSVFLFGKMLENEIEKSLVRSTPLDEFEIEGSSSLLGESENQDLSLKVGTRFSSNVYLSYEQSLSLSQTYQVGVEYRLSPNVSVVVSYDENGQIQVKYRLKRQF